MDIAAIVIQLVAGIAGGNAAGVASKATTLGPVGNSVAGGVGGVILAQIVPMIMGNTALASSGIDLASVAMNFGEGVVAGAATAVIIGFIKTKMAKA